MKKVLALLMVALFAAGSISGCNTSLAAQHENQASVAEKAESTGKSQSQTHSNDATNKGASAVESKTEEQTQPEKNTDKADNNQARSSVNRPGMEDSNCYVATVAGEKITEDEYRYFLMAARNSIEQQAGIKGEEARKSFWKGNLGDQTAEEYTKKLALENAKEFKILLVKAKAAGLTVGQEETDSMNAQIDSYVKSLGTGDDGAREYERQFGMSADKVKAINPDLRLVQKFAYEELKKIQPSDEEIKKYYDENSQKYQMVTVKHILFLTRDLNTKQLLSQEKQNAAKKNAEDILAKVKAGEDMAALAKQYSEDPGSKDSGGEYTFSRGRMVKEFEDWSFNAKAGDVGLIKTEYGYHIIRLEKIISFEDIKDQVKSDLTEKKYNDLLDQWRNDPRYELIKNDSVFDRMKILENE